MARMDYEKAKREERARAPKGETAPVAWWWTVGGGGWCACGEPVVRDRPYAWNQATQTAMCEECVEENGLAPAKSRRYRSWEARQ